MSNHNTQQVVVTETNTVLVEIATAGPRGPVGLTGETGDQGEKGDTGEKGDPGVPGPPKSLTIAYPMPGDNLTLFYTQIPTELTQVAAIVRGTDTPSVTYQLKYASDRSAAGTSATASAAVTSTTTAVTASLEHQPIPANNFLWLEVSAISGNPTELSVTVSV
jgi:hypothetical protein